MQTDERVPQDVGLLISRLHGPAMRLACATQPAGQGRTSTVELRQPPGFAAEMSPDASDPERQQLLKVAQGTIDQLASEPEQNTGLYRWALERLDQFLDKRLTRRLASLASQVGALQKLEDKLCFGQPSRPPCTARWTCSNSTPCQPTCWTTTPRRRTHRRRPRTGWRGCSPGDWVRMFLQGRWVQAQALWPGRTPRDLAAGRRRVGCHLGRAQARAADHARQAAWPRR
jgi:hypothetical protein